MRVFFMAAAAAAFLVSNIEVQAKELNPIPKEQYIPEWKKNPCYGWAWEVYFWCMDTYNDPYACSDYAEEWLRVCLIETVRLDTAPQVPDIPLIPD